MLVGAEGYTGGVIESPKRFLKKAHIVKRATQMILGFFRRTIFPPRAGDIFSVPSFTHLFRSDSRGVGHGKKSPHT